MQRNVFGIGLASILIAAAGAAADNAKVTRNGGACIEVGAGSAQVLLTLDNATGAVATDITVSIEGANAPKITEVDLLGTDKDKVDDDGDGKHDEADETDTKAKTPSKTVKTILVGANIKKNAKGTNVTVKFDGPTQQGNKIRVKYSTKIGDTHYDMLVMSDVSPNSPGGFCMVDAGAAQIAPGLIVTDPAMGIEFIELFGNPQNPILDVQLPLPHAGFVEYDGPNALVFIDPPLPPMVPHNIGLILEQPVTEPWQVFPIEFGVGLVPLGDGFCIADFNEDGQVNILDFVAFQNAWSQQDPAADINNDGVWNVLDFVAFQNEWEKGCVSQVAVHTDFEDFDLGSSCQNGWEAWDNNGACGLITDINSRSGEQCLLLDNEDGDVDDVVRQFEDVTEGVWHMQLWTYIPAEAEGVSYISLFNEYTQGGNKDWSAIYALDATQGLIIDDPLNQDNPISVPYIVDQWVPIDVIVDLENDVTNVFYAGEQFVFDKSWTAGVGGVGISEIQAVNLYADSCTQIFYDDIMLVRLDD